MEDYKGQFEAIVAEAAKLGNVQAEDMDALRQSHGNHGRHQVQKLIVQQI